MSKYTKSNHTRFFLCMAAVVVMSGLANADTVEVSNADSYIFNASADENFGDETSSLIKMDSVGAWTRITYLRFDVSEDNITAATLTLNFVDSGLGVAGSDTVFGFKLYGLNENVDTWLESSITWNNAPTLAGASDLGVSSAVGKGVGTSLLFSGDQLKNFLNNDTDGSVSLVLVRTTPSSNGNTYAHAIATRENSVVASRPSLTAIPEPAVLSMVAMFGGGILFINRKFR